MLDNTGQGEDFEYSGKHYKIHSDGSQYDILVETFEDRKIYVEVKSKDKYAIENILDRNYDTNLNLNTKLKTTNYVKKVFYLINKIRTNPAQFSEYIISSEKYIKEIEDRVIYDNKIKVALNERKKMFSECAEYLRTLPPMEELSFNDDIVLECPTEQNSIKDINYFKQKVIEKKESQKIEAYFKDSISEPEISVLLFIVDDSTKNPKKKREAVLNPKYKYFIFKNVY